MHRNMIPSLTSFGEFSLNFRYGHLLAKFTVCEPSEHLVVLCRDQSTYTDSQLMQNLYIMVYCIFKRLVDCRFLQASFRAMRQTFLLWLVLTILNFFNMAVTDIIIQGLNFLRLRSGDHWQGTVTNVCVPFG